MAFESVLKLVLILTYICGDVHGQHSIIRFDKEEITEIVKSHNDLRRSIYNAANMRELTWNEALAMAAAEWGTECEYVTRPDSMWGQNMNYFHGKDYHTPAMDMFRNSFKSWSNESQHYDYRRYRFCGRKNVCSYVQLIAADVEQVGCSIVRCPRLQLKDPYGIQTHAKLLVCFYTPWIDINHKEVFIPKERCAACPTGTVCANNLCSSRFSGKDDTTYKSIGAPKINIEISSISGKRLNTIFEHVTPKSNLIPSDRSNTVRDRSRNRITDNTNTDRKTQIVNSAYGKYNTYPRSFTSNTIEDEPMVIYTPNNRVVPFPGKKEARDIRKIEKYERKLEKRKKNQEKKKKHKNNRQQNELQNKPEQISETNDSSNSTVLNRKKRQTSYEDALYQRRLEYRRYLQELRDREMLQRERRRKYEEDLRRQYEHNRRQRKMMELRRASDDQRRYQQDERERRRLRRIRERRRRQELMALLQSEGELTGEEQFNTISAHNILRRSDGARELSWSSHLEKWAKYVIRCETEYPGPITCFTNFGKANGGQEIYNVVYEWGAEGDDLRRPMRYGCRTPYDQSVCNHNSILRDKSITQMACAAKNCGLERQLTCIYNSS